MKIKHKLLLLILISVIIIISVFFLFKKKDMIWTSKNSLKLSTLTISGDRGNFDDLIKSIDQSLLYYSKIDPDTKFDFDDQWCSAADMKICLEDFREKLNKYGLSDKFLKYINANYATFRTATDDLLVTGYFEATLFGSFEKCDEYKYPLYKKPDDLVNVILSEFPVSSRIKGLPLILRGRLDNDNRVIPYYSREDIDIKGSLNNKGLELLWISDNIDLFFLHIQGSGVVIFDDDSKVRVNYADTNGHPYRAIGKVLVDKGICTYDDLSMQYIERYLKDHPEEIDDIFNYNPSYIFFREVEDGPVGSLGVNVTKYRSIATDKYIFPRGAICYLETSLPEFDEKGDMCGEQTFSSFVLNQDTGGAIRSPSRADLFTGNGKESEFVAGHLKSNGKLYFLVKIDLLKSTKYK